MGAPPGLQEFPSLVDAEVDGSWPLGAAAQVLLLRHLREVLSRRGPVAQGSDDIEHLHKLRVSCRRLRSALHGVSGLWPRKKAEAALKAIKRLAKACSRARDLDVEAEHLSALLPAASPEEELALRWLWSRARQARHEEQARVSLAIRRFDEQGWPETLVALFSTRPFDLSAWTPPRPKSKSRSAPRKGQPEGDARGGNAPDDARASGRRKAPKRRGRTAAERKRASDTRNTPRRTKAESQDGRPSRNLGAAEAEPRPDGSPLLPLPATRKRAQ